MQRAWYAYVGNFPGDEYNAGSWVKIPPQSPDFPGIPRFECVGTQSLCAINACYAGSPQFNINPKSPLSQNIQIYITQANVTSVNAFPQIGSRYYLYKKSV